MQQFRELLPQNLWQTLWKEMNRKLGQEEMLRLLWPALVGPNLAAQTYLKQLRGKTLVVAIPHRDWRSPLESLEPAILEALQRFLGRSAATSPTSVELVVDESLDEPKATRKSAARSSFPKTSRPPGEVLTPEEPGEIADESLRQVFLRSAQKYFDRPESRHRREVVR